jgi:hypothetical protein
MSNFTIDEIMDKKVSFSVLTAIAGTIGRDFQNVVVSELISWSSAKFFNTDVVALHQNIYRQLPAGTIINDPTKYKYLVLKFANGQTKVVGLPWIEWSSIVIHTNQKIVVEVLEPKTTDVELVRTQLSSVGLKIGSINLVDI